jgi:predicted nucleic acid-binding Zn ribbon protein
MSNDDLEPLSDTLSQVFARLGFADPELLSTISSEWETLAPTPWPQRSRPVGVRGKTLVVEAASPSMVAFLRYGVTHLLAAIAARVGEGVIEGVDVRPPGRS